MGYRNKATKGYKMIKYYKTTKAFDYLNADEVYRTNPLDKAHTRFWNEDKDCGTFIPNWKVKQAIKAGVLIEVN